MSARQRARLQQKGKIEEVAKQPSPEDEDESSEEEADTVPQSKSVFVFDNSDDSSSDDDSTTGLKQEVPIATNKKPIPAVKSKVVETQVKRGGVPDEDEELKYLDEELAKIQGDLKDKDGNNSSSGTVRAVVRNLLKVDVKNLDIDSIMRKRFGSESVRRGNEDGDGERPRIKPPGKGKPMPSKLTNRRLIFGTPKEDWTRPPSYVGGGVGMVAYDPTSQTQSPDESVITTGATSDSIPESGGGIAAAIGPMYFKFIHSAEFQRLNSQYQMIADSGDVNRLAIFLSTHPYHSEGLLQLAMVFARTGSMDRAVDFVRRSLYCCEMAFIEAFKPAQADAKMELSLPENRPFLSSLVRHMQMSNMLGCPSVSAEVGKILLSLAPYPGDDPYGVLLALDFYLLSAGKYSEVFAFAGLTLTSSRDTYKVSGDWSIGGRTAGSAIGSGNSGCGGGSSSDGDKDATLVSWFLRNAWSSPLDQSTAASSSSAAASSNITTTTDALSDMKTAAGGGDLFLSGLGSGPGLGVNDSSSSSLTTFRLAYLPNWWFSLALAAYKRGKVFSQSSGGGGGANEWESQARQLLQKALEMWPFMLEPLMKKAGAQTGSSLWRPIFTHPYFSTALSRLPFDGSNNGILTHIGEIFVTRNAPLWSRDELHRWVALSAKELLSLLDADADLMHCTMAMQTNLYAHLSVRYIFTPAPRDDDQSSSSARPCPYRLDRHYRTLLVEDFQEEYPRLPPEANPLDPRLADPAAFARVAPGQGPGQGGNRRGGNMMQQAGGGRGQDPLAMLQALAMQDDEDTDGMGGMDMEALLAQLGPQLDPQNREAILQALMELQGGDMMMPPFPPNDDDDT